MWAYEKKLQYPVKITTPNPALAKIIITQLGGPNGRLGGCGSFFAKICAKKVAFSVEQV